MIKGNSTVSVLKRKRAANWDTIEKNLLRNCIREFVSIIENKNTDTNTNKSKNVAWEKITQRFNELNSRERNMAEIKQQWRTTKLEAKKIVSEYKRERSGTGGGHKPPSPGPDIYEIIEMIPKEFEVDSNKFDSDGVIKTLKYDSEGSHNCEASSSDAAAAADDAIEVFQIIHSPTHNKENTQAIITTPLASIPMENLGPKNILKPRTTKRKLPFEANYLAKQRTELLTKCLKEEHDLKMRQMLESHEWAREEHQLRLKEAELRIENLEIENLLLKTKMN